jgi:hypothetical protein
MQARVTANASSAMISAPSTSIHGRSTVRRDRGNRCGEGGDGRCGGPGGRRSYLACIAGCPPTGACGGRPQGP